MNHETRQRRKKARALPCISSVFCGCRVVFARSFISNFSVLFLGPSLLKVKFSRTFYLLFIITKYLLLPVPVSRLYTLLVWSWNNKCYSAFSLCFNLLLLLCLQDVFGNMVQEFFALNAANSDAQICESAAVFLNVSGLFNKTEQGKHMFKKKFLELILSTRAFIVVWQGMIFSCFFVIWSVLIFVWLDGF